VDSLDGKSFPVINPSNGKIICNVAEAGKDDVDRAVKAAQMVISIPFFPLTLFYFL